MIQNRSKFIGGILLVSGTAIGAGMLALPISTAKNGFLWSVFAFLCCWFFITVAALLLLEVNLRLKGEKDLISMANATLGIPGKVIAWISYLLLLYALICAYLKGSSAWMVKLLEEQHIHLATHWAMIIIFVLYSVVVSYGTGVSEKINRGLMIGLILSYIVLVYCVVPSVDISKIGVGSLTDLSSTFPLVITSFGFSIILPSLTNYLNRDVQTLRWVVILGGLLPFVIYLIWEFIAFGVIPFTGDHSLQMLAENHDDGTGVAVALEQIIGNPWITSSSQWFAIFAILTSLLGVSLALFHFLADGFQIKQKTGVNRLLLSAFTYIPPFILLFVYPSGFGRILSFAGIFVAILMGILPVLMVWQSRHQHKKSKTKSFAEKPYQVRGGSPLLVAVFIFFVTIIYLEIVNCLVCPLS